MSGMDEIEALLESSKAEVQRASSRRNGEGSSRRSPSPSGRSHTSSRSHRRSSKRERSRSRSRSRSPRVPSRSRSPGASDSRRSSRRHGAVPDDDDTRSHHSSSSRRTRRERDDDRDYDDDRDRKRRSDSRDRERRRSDRDRDRDSRRDRDKYRDSPRDRDSHRDSRRDDRRSSGRRSSRDARDSPRYDSDRRGRSPSPHRMTEEEHEMRSVFVSQLSARVGDRELFQFFEAHVGKVRDARVILDRVSRRSKGVAYVEFFELEDVKKAIALTGTKLLGIPLSVQYTEAERNRQAGLTAAPIKRADVPDHITLPPGSDASGDHPVPWNRLYVGSLPFSLREHDIRQIFEPFGPIDSVDLHFDNITQKSKGYCFVQYRKQLDAQQALEKMNGFEIAGRPIRVGLVTEKGSNNRNQNQGADMHHQNAGGPGMAGGPPGQGGPPGMHGGPRNPNQSGMMRPDSLEDSGNGFGAISRIELMQKLARTEPPSSAGLAAPTMPMFRVNVPTATSRCVQLKNMFDPAEETEPNWDNDLRDDVKDECESKYGKVVEIYIEKDSAGEMFLKFDFIESATKAVTGLNGRFFGGKQITAAYISDAILEAHRK